MTDNKELLNDDTTIDAEAASAVSDSEGTFTLKLSNDVEYKGIKYRKLIFDFDSLTGADAVNIEDELAQKGKIVINPIYNGDYLMIMAAKACCDSIGADMFLSLSIVDYNRIRTKARSFLMRTVM